MQYNPAQKYLDLRARNLQFFSEYYPGIFQFLSSYQMQSAKLDILPASDEIDILVEGKHLYKQQSLNYAKQEVATFLAAYDYGSKIHSFRPLEKDAYKNQRFFARSMSRLHESYYARSSSYAGYELDDFFPLLVFMGIGLAKHIDIMTRIRDISHIIALESNPDHFAASLYSVDWRSIVEPYLKDPQKSFEFVLLSDEANEQQIYSALWNTLLHYCPIFPVTTLFYNHMGKPLFDRITDKINADIYIHLFSFGNVDDELNQLNNALHNFRQRIPLISIDNIKDIQLPVCIVGSGPSLDQRIEDLKQLAENAIIISSGTALRALWKHGITPDFQVELESDFNTYVTQGMMEDKHYMHSVKLLGAAQLNPLMFSLFKEARLFFKEDGALSNWFGSPDSIVEHATPTCTNAALALSFKFKAARIFLFGLDYGFPDKQSHHASGSVYYKGSLKEQYAVNQDDLIEVPSAQGGMILTTTFLFTAKRRIENMLVLSGNSKVYNCSNGSRIENTQWLSSEEVREVFDELMRQANPDKQYFSDCLFNTQDKALDEAFIQKQADFISSEMHELISRLSTRISKAPLNTKRHYSELCAMIFPFIKTLSQENKSMFYFIRGSIWHFLLAAQTHVYSLPKQDIPGYLNEWKDCFLEMLATLERRCRSITHKTLHMDQDPMVNHRLCEALMEELIWTYQNFSIMDGNIIEDSSDT